MSSKTIVDALKKQARVGEYHEWKPGSQVAIDPEKAWQEFGTLYREQRAVTPELVVQRAEPEQNVLHDHFEWDDPHAAAHYRLQQASQMMRSMVVRYRAADGTSTPPVRALVKITRSAEEDNVELSEDNERAYEPRVYIPIVKAMSEEELRTRYVRQALRELQVFRQRYKAITQFADLFTVIDRLEGSL